MTSRSAPVPPQALDAEESLLGAAMLSDRVLETAAELVQPADFYRESHGLLYQQMQELEAAGESVDAITLIAGLRRTGRLAKVGGEARVRELAHLVPTTANAAHYARIIADAAARRRLIRAGGEIAQLGWDGLGELPDLYSHAGELLDSACKVQGEDGYTPLGDSVDVQVERLRKILRGEDDEQIIPTGFYDLDRRIIGLAEGQLIVIAARPAMGKSTLALNIAQHVAEKTGPVAFTTLEMSKNEVALKLLAKESGITTDILRSAAAFRNLRDEQKAKIAEAQTKLRALPVLVDFDPGVSVVELRARLRKVHRRDPLSLVVVDYIQLMAAADNVENRTQALSQITRGLKVLAGDLRVPVVACSQLSRAVEQRADKRPMLSDLRESGSIEQDADVVLFIYRDDYYNPDVPDNEKGTAEINVAKQRLGQMGAVKLGFSGGKNTFYNQAKGVAP